MVKFVKKKLKSQVDTKILPFAEIEKQLMEGKKKQQITEWWLQLIETSVENFVHELPGITKNSIPYDYLDKAPHSLDAIQQNLEIIRKLIHPQKYGDLYQVRVRLIEPLSTQIYSELDQFLRQATLLCLNVILETQFVLNLEQTQRTSDNKTNQTDLQKQNTTSSEDLLWIQQHYSELKPSITKLPQALQRRLENLEELIRDIEYIEKMKVLESQVRSLHHVHQEDQLQHHNQPQTQQPSFTANFNSSPLVNSPSTPTCTSLSDQDSVVNRGPVSDIVPITGLIVGALHRMENEHKTVFEHWSPRLRFHPKN